MDFIPCLEKHLPAHERVAAAKTAVACNPANCPSRRGLAALDIASPMHAALLTTKYWGAAGARLTVSFLDDAPADLQARVVQHANAWGQGTSVRFSLVRSDGQIRVARNEQAYYSYLGTDNLHIPAGQHTMMLGGFTMGTPESEYLRVVRHEFGHALGLIHEHMRRQLVALLDVAKTLAVFEREQGWSEAEVRAQVLTPAEESALTATPRADQDSIMCYQISGECTISGQPIRGGLDIDALDRTLAAKLYPPTAPPPPSGPSARQVADPVFAALLAQAAHRPLELVQLRHVKSLFDAYADAHP